MKTTSAIEFKTTPKAQVSSYLEKFKEGRDDIKINFIFDYMKKIEDKKFLEKEEERKYQEWYNSLPVEQASPEEEEAIGKGFEDMRAGRYVECRTQEESQKFLDSLSKQ